MEHPLQTPIAVTTPTLYSTQLSRHCGLDVWLKLEALQPSGSFKLRGVGHLCQVLRSQGARGFVSSSGGNAGYAVAYAGRQLGVAVTVVVPETTSERAKQLIRGEGAELLVHGRSWQEANARAQALLRAGVEFVHPFDDPLLWEGHALLVDELLDQMPADPDVVICSVGGGGLLAGVCQGLLRLQRSGVGVLAVETEGTASYAAALQAGRPVELPAITSLATSLGARTVCAEAVAWAHRLAVRNLVVSDADAIAGSVRLMDAHRLVTELACGASIAGLDRVGASFPDARRVVVVVCGGVGVSDRQLREWSEAEAR